VEAVAEMNRTIAVTSMEQALLEAQSDLIQQAYQAFPYVVLAIIFLIIVWVLVRW
jgi:hypothetical protein